MGDRPCFELVCLAELDQKFWRRGLPVFHPMLQIGDTPYWDPTDYPETHRDEEEVDGPAWDVGVIDNWWSEDLHPDHPRVQFLMSNNSCLNYGAYNLWVPKELVDALSGLA